MRSQFDNNKMVSPKVIALLAGTAVGTAISLSWESITGLISNLNIPYISDHKTSQNSDKKEEK